MPIVSPERRWRGRAIELLARAADRVSRPRRPDRPIDPGRVSRLLLIKPCCLGDMLMATPVLRALKRHFPDAVVDVLTTDWSAPALENNPNVHAILQYPQNPSPVRLLALAQRLRQRRYDIGISLDRSPLVNGLLMLAGVPERAGIDSRGRGVGLTRRASPKPRQHETSLYLSVIETLGVPSQGEEAEYFPADDARRQAERLIGGSQHPIVVIHPGGALNPGSVMLSKRWPAISFGELASLLVEREGATVVLVGALSDRDAVQVAADFTDGPVIDLGGQLSIAELAAVSERADLYVGNDSGASHLASAVGTPTVTIFGPTSPYQYRPLGPHAEVRAPAGSWNPDLVGLDLRGRRSPLDPGADIREVSVAEVYQACREQLSITREIKLL